MATPKELFELYTTGKVKGCHYDAEGLKDFLRKAPHPFFGISADDLAGSGEGKLSTPYKSYRKLDPGAYTERQVTGDCVSMATRNAVDLARAVEIDIKGEPEEWITRGATEGIYGSRGHGGQGMPCSGAARFVTATGGLLLRQKYDFADFSDYNKSVKLGIGWGSRGVPNEVIKTAKERQVGTASSIRTLDEARDAVANGYGVAVCSGYGFSNKRDSFGVSQKQGSWAHALHIGACDDRPETSRKYNGSLWLIVNSWGKWNDGGHPDWGPIPDGSFLITSKDMQGMLSQNGSFVFSNVDGFPLRKLPDYGTASFL